MLILKRSLGTGLQIGPDCTLIVGEVCRPEQGASRVWIHGTQHRIPYGHWCTNHKNICIAQGITIVTFNHKRASIAIGVQADMRIVRLETLDVNNPFDPAWDTPLMDPATLTPRHR